ncbi:MAG: hypothetical protein CMI09_16250 [Oceanospirillaceae bacterium]|nr:hypothetical protein [Oceanospirillaceae bacterium]
MKIVPRVLKLEVNNAGRDFVVGDIHGELPKLIKQLKTLEFNTSTDRLICVGDLVDRGPESAKTLELLDKPWFYSVLGNHEVLMVSSMKYNNSSDRMIWLSNGGEWIASTSPAQWPAWFDTIEQLPLAIEVENREGTRYGIVHADFPGDHWDELANFSEEDAARCVWSRGSFNSRSKHVIEGIDVLIHGHNVVEEELHLGNRWYIEPGAFKGNDFIIKQL